MPSRASSVPQLHRLLERLSTLLRSDLREVATRHDLKLVQLEALLFFSMSNRYSDTPAALTEYLGVTKGTASQTIKALERRGLVDKSPDEDDARVVHCAPTAEGQAIAQDAFPSQLLGALAEDRVAVAVAGLDGLLRALQREGGARTFDVCHTCRHFQRERTRGRCGLTHERLSTRATLQICREHEPL